MVDDILGLTAQIVSAHVQRNSVEVDALSDLIREVHRTLSELRDGNAPAESSKPAATPMAPTSQTPAVPVTRSVFNDHIICLEDGKKMTMLKRHLMTEHNLTVDQYRAKWNLPSNYPMVAPAYAATRSTLAKQMGLGRGPQAKRGGRRSSK